ncbi:hypothetical protein [Methylomonas methanica]|uniref:Uncharacterized protein n=1 Tax=Methylomonas methanica TaxID=421 RepID=A0A177MI23_METMH|nr:hypothetical protein [Methylomonas methanica]OAI05456.1 hypothetical protein A1332_12910 [Methylomonas methanica]
MKNPAELLFPTSVVILLSFYSSLVSAQLIDYSYTGNPFYYGKYQVQINFQINDALISNTGHFDKNIDLTTDTSPFNGFRITDGTRTIDDFRLDPEIYGNRFHKVLNVSFDIDASGDIKDWKIIANDNYISPSGDSYYSIQSIFNVQNNPSWDAVITTDTDHWSNSERTTTTSVDTSSYGGYWTRSAVPIGTVPLPGSIYLFVMGLCSLLWRKNSPVV